MTTSGQNSRCYPLTFDATSSAYVPLTIRVRAKLWDPIAVQLKNRIEVADAEGSAWIAAGKLRVVPTSKRLIEAGRAAEFTVEIGSNLTLEDILAARGLTRLKVTIFPDKSIPMPGAPVPIETPPVSSVCEVKVGLPVSLETDTDPFLAAAEGRDGVYLSARVNFYLPCTDPETEKKIRDSIAFTQRSGQLIVDQNPKIDGAWKRVLVYPLPGNEHLVREQNNIVEVTAKALYEDLMVRVILPFEEQGLELTIEPQPKLKLNGRDSVCVRAKIRSSSVLPLPQAERDAALAGLRLIFDAVSAPHLQVSGRQQGADEVRWTLTGSVQQATSPPKQAALKAATIFRGKEVSARKILNLEIDDSSLEVFFNPGVPLRLGEGDGVWLFARVRESASIDKARATAATKVIQFSLSGPNSDLLRRNDEQDSGDYHTIRLSGSAPSTGSLAAGTPLVRIDTTVGGKPLTELVDLPVELGMQLHARVNDSSSAVVKYDSRNKKWLIPVVNAWFSAAGQENPIATNNALASPPVRVEDQLLQATGVTRGAKGEWQIVLEPNAANRDLWEKKLKENGEIVVQVLARSGDGSRTFEASVRLHFIVEYDLIVEQIDKNGRPVTSRSYVDPAGKEHSVEVPAGEIACDGADKIRLRVKYCRRDGGSVSIPPGTQRTFEIQGPDKNAFQLQAELTQSNGGASKENEFVYTLSSTIPLLATRERLSRTLPILFELAIEDPSGKKRRASANYKVSLRPLFLEFWIFPAMIRGQSAVSAYIALFPDRDCSIGGVSLELSIIAQPAVQPRLDLVGVATVKSDEKGFAFWTVAYREINWNNAVDARFHLRCRLGNSPECRFRDVDVQANGQKFLAELNRRASIADPDDPQGLNLNNPEFGKGATRLDTLDYIIPDDARGAYYNVRSLYYGTGPDIPRWLYCYTCGEMRKRITDFAVDYRFGKTTGVEMNGLEYANYALGELHDFFGIHLSGGAPKDDPWFLDPWWRQRWQEDEIAHSWKTENYKAFWVVVTLLCHFLLLMKFIMVAARFVKSYLPDINSYQIIIRGRAALAKWIHGRGALLNPNGLLAKALSWSWFAFKSALLFVGLPYLLRNRVMAHDNYFENNFDYKPATLMKEYKRRSFIPDRSEELMRDLPEKLQSMDRAENW